MEGANKFVVYIVEFVLVGYCEGEDENMFCYLQSEEIMSNCYLQNEEGT